MTRADYTNSWQTALEEVRKVFNNPMIQDTLLTEEQEKVFLDKFGAMIVQFQREDTGKEIETTVPLPTE